MKNPVDECHLEADAPPPQGRYDAVVKPRPSLEQLLKRGDVWRGQSQRFVIADVVDSGYAELNRILHNGGWPTTGAIEVCQAYHACEWWVFHPAIRALLQRDPNAHLALLNPPALPFISGLKPLGITGERLLMVRIKTPQEYMACLVELGRSSACSVVLAWQPQNGFGYTQLRKLQLCAGEHHGLYVHFRPLSAHNQSSPASLRLIMNAQANGVHVHIFKQKGLLKRSDVTLPCPTSWERLPTHNKLLDRALDTHTAALNQPDGATREPH